MKTQGFCFEDNRRSPRSLIGAKPNNQTLKRVNFSTVIGVPIHCPDVLALQRDLVLQRLYSSFARGWPGAGLLSLRLVAPVAVFHDAVASGQPLFRIVVEGAAGLLLCVGRWTPIAGSVLAALAVWSLFSESGDPWFLVLLAAVSAAVAMLGPGALVDRCPPVWKKAPDSGAIEAQGPPDAAPNSGGTCPCSRER